MQAARKVRTTVTLRSETVRRAKALRLNISQVCERALEAELKAREREKWLEENEEAMDAYGEVVKKHGLFSDQWRRF